MALTVLGMSCQRLELCAGLRYVCLRLLPWSIHRMGVDGLDEGEAAEAWTEYEEWVAVVARKDPDSQCRKYAASLLAK